MKIYSYYDDHFNIRERSKVLHLFLTLKKYAIMVAIPLALFDLRILLIIGYWMLVIHATKLGRDLKTFVFPRVSYGNCSKIQDFITLIPPS